MTAAEQLRKEIANSDIIDRKKVLESIINGIRTNGECLVYEPYNPPSEIIYNSGSIQISSLKEETAIREFALSQGFRIMRAYHPVSGRLYGFYVKL